MTAPKPGLNCVETSAVISMEAISVPREVAIDNPVGVTVCDKVAAPQSLSPQDNLPQPAFTSAPTETVPTVEVRD